MDSGRVAFGEQVISLTATEYNLLELLRRNPDFVSLVSAPFWIVCGEWMGLLCTIAFIRSDYPIDPRHSADSESLACDRAKFAQMAVARVITKPIQPLTLTEQVAEILGWVD